VSPHPAIRWDDRGAVLISPARIFRAGVYPTRVGDRVLRIMHHPRVLARDAATFNGAPLRIEHFADAHATVGEVDNVRMDDDGLFMLADLVIWNRGAVDSCRSGMRRQLSIGYDCAETLQPGVIDGFPYDGFATRIIGDHVALVRQGDAGHLCAVEM
jgi:hypothetical protein